MDLGILQGGQALLGKQSSTRLDPASTTTPVSEKLQNISKKRESVNNPLSGQYSLALEIFDHNKDELIDARDALYNFLIITNTHAPSQEKEVETEEESAEEHTVSKYALEQYAKSVNTGEDQELSENNKDSSSDKNEIEDKAKVEDPVSITA